MIRIYTFGDFDIRINGESILDSIGNHTKLIKLFKYFLTFQGKKLLPDKIIEDMWEDEEFEDSLSVLRTQISRIRSIVNFKKYKIKPFFKISYIDGYYLFKLSDDCTVDYLVMESYIKRQQESKNKQEKIELGERVIKLYNGEYLGELGSVHWILPIRSRFERLYIDSVFKHLQLLSEMSMDNYIVCLCEEIINLIPYEENIHIYYIKSLLSLGRVRPALNDYMYYTSKLYNELGLSPSSNMISLYKSIGLKEENTSSSIALDSLDIELKDCDNYEGALICDSCYFKFLYNFKNRTKKRYDKNIFIGITTIDKSGYGEIPEKDLKKYMRILLGIIRSSLRKGDTITQWNKNQVLLLLSYLGEDNVSSLIDRLKQNFKQMIDNEKVDLNIKFKKI